MVNFFKCEEAWSLRNRSIDVRYGLKTFSGLAICLIMVSTILVRNSIMPVLHRHKRMARIKRDAN